MLEGVKGGVFASDKKAAHANAWRLAVWAEQDSNL